jgi:TolB-like protein
MARTTASIAATSLLLSISMVASAEPGGVGEPTTPKSPAQRAQDTTPDASTNTITVAVFSNITGASEDAWIGAGITATLTADFAAVGPVRVLGQLAPSSNALVAPDAARWAIDGAYQRVGQRLRITAQIVEVATEIVVHAARVDGQMSDLFALQDQLSADLRRGLPTGSVAGATLMAARARSITEPVNAGTESPPPAPVIPTSTSSSGGLKMVPAGLIDGPPPPAPPAVIARDAVGRVTARAVRLPSPLQIDGQLDEDVYTSVPSMSDFIQAEPQEGEPTTEQTEAWVTFDHEYVYISFRCWDSHPERIVANEMRRDSSNVVRNDFVAFSLDTYYDRRNSYLFVVNAIGGRMDGESTDESQYNGDWNPIWHVAVGRFDGGWTVETAVPFTSLRYRPGRAQVWGFNLRRDSPSRNEVSYLTPIPNVLAMNGLPMASLAATLVGLEAPEKSRALEIKPYAISEISGNRLATPQISNALGADVGLDVKYGVTQNLTADLTVNTDFAQVEADTQQINLTRFSLFFPEKREFFLENQGLFAFGGAGGFGGGSTPILFHSRQIGLDQGQEVPIEVGGRLTGRVGAFSLGVMNIQTGDATESGAPATNFSVVRVKRNILRRSSIGALFTARSVSTRDPTGSNEAYGVDGTFAFFDVLTINGYWAETRTPELDGDAVSYRTQLDYNGDRYGLQLERLVVGKDFNPEVGFLRRSAFERSFVSARFSPRPMAIAAIRKLSWSGRVDYITDRDRVLETRDLEGQFGIEFESSDRFNVRVTRSYELLDRPFRIAPGVSIPVGGFTFRDVQASFGLGQHRRFSGTLSAQHGSFFSGERTSLGLSGGHLELTPQFSVEPSVSYNRIDLPEGRFTTGLVSTRTTYSVTPLMFVSALLQYNSSNNSLSTNVRLRWEFLPGSELFVVYNEQRDTLAINFPELENRALVIKINRLFQF